MAHLLPAAGMHRQWRPSPRPLALVMTINSALLCMAATGEHAQQSDSTAATPASAATAKRVDSRKWPEIELKDSAENQHQPGSSVKVNKRDLERQGAGDFADILQYQPLVSIPGVSAGSDGTSAYDHPDSSNYNIRGGAGNHIGMDVDDMEIPEAGGRQATSDAGRTSGSSSCYYRVSSYASYDLTGYWRTSASAPASTTCSIRLAGITRQVYTLTPSLVQDVLDMQWKRASGHNFFISASIDY